ncbi:MAG: hypothetical protein ABIP75_03915 [Pyrinomonadaceae bacterium]
MYLQNDRNYDWNRNIKTDVENVMYWNARQKIYDNALERVSRQFPRIQVMLILGLTGVTVFLTSFSLLHLGVTQMVIRYPLAIAVGYGGFTLFIGLWLWLQRNGLNELDALDVVDVGSGIELPGGGGGWEGDNQPAQLSSGGGRGGSRDSGIDLPDIGLDLDEGIWVVLAIIALLAGLIAIFYVIYIAPVLLAEVLVDSLLAAGLYRSVKDAQGRHWIKTVLRKTLIPAILALICFTLAGFFAQKIEPRAVSLGEVWQSISDK